MKLKEILSVISIALIISILSGLFLFGILDVASGVGMNTIITAFLLIIGITISANLIFYFVFKRYMRERIQRKIMLALTEDEQKVVREIMNMDEKVKQKDLGRRLDFSNSKLSALLNNLEKKNVLTKNRYRRTNTLHLSDEFNT